ncbi:sensor histidine kinase [Rhizohabitans arisaemae]|uniref:sensor histidine kinase n=1 Tax=Rhizohabitans arisaemae TaxID=2720610 RepID=UPI0024B0CBF6|nr:histidine kinase [Rhizohabitans arisaemae]
MRGVPIERGAELGGFRRYTWWSLAGTIMLFLVLFVRDWVVDPDVAVWARVLGVGALAVLVVAGVVLLSLRLPRVPDDARHLPVAWIVAGSMAAAVLGVIPLTLREYGLWSLAPATMVSIIATFLPPRRRRTLIAAAVIGAAAIGGIVSLASGDPWLFAAAFPAGMVAFVAWMTLGMLWAWDIAERLNRARRLAAELAVKDERLRFAADLHDIQGHHLQVIALKSELAARLVTADPARAAAEMEQVRRLAADALQDTRAVVQGYRRTSLDEELANAVKVLAAADIDTRMERDPDSVTRVLPETGRHLLGLVMREATTNMLRHSQARHAQVGYRVTAGSARLWVSNDGAADPPRRGTGTGLRTLAERMAAAGGALTWEHDGERFKVAASLPVDAAVDAG